MEEGIKDNLYRDIQTFFSSDTVFIVGSGLSCAEGLPGMWQLAGELIKKVPEELVEEDKKEWEKIKTDLLDNEGLVKNDANLESTLLKNPPSENLEILIRKITTEYIKKEEKKVIEKVILGEKVMRFSSLIKRFKLPGSGLPIICTNYDRLIEIACEVEGIPVDNLFYGKYISQLDEKKSQMSFCEGIERSGKSLRRIFSQKVSIYKPHGCLNWYLYNGEPINSTFNLELERLIITPGANKYRSGYNAPFDIHRSKANTAIDAASKFMIIGYGFNDEHLETHLKQRIISGIPTLILTHSLSENCIRIIKNRENVIALSCFKDEDKSGTKIFYKNNNYLILGLDLWDSKKLTEAVL